MLLAWLMLESLLAQQDSPVLDAAWNRFWRDLVVEGAGLFWIGAELGILFLVSVGARVLRERPLPEQLRLTRAEWRWGIVLAIGLLALMAGVFGRFAVWTPMPQAIEAAASLDRRTITDAVHGEMIAHIKTHLAIWCAFILAWVLLEIAIVVQGIRAFRALSDLVGAPPANAVRATAAAIVLGVSIWFVADEASAAFTRPVEMALQSGYKGAVEDARVAYRFVELYLRVAGAIWVAVEWIAAVYLVRGYFLLRQFFRERPHVA